MSRIKRTNTSHFEDLPFPSIKESLVRETAKILAKQIEKEIFKKKYASAQTVLKIVGGGMFLAASLAMPNLPRVLKPFLNNQEGYEVWKRFNIPYLKRTLKRLEKQKLVELGEEEEKQVVRITERGKKRILRFAIDELAVERPRFWDGKWRLISYDIPGRLRRVRNIFREYLRVWGFYPLHESAFLHAYPCEKQVEFLRGYLRIGEYVRIFQVSRIENDELFRDFFGV